MCGIVGIFGYNQPVQSYKGYIDKCLHTMQRRGPDSNGIWNDAVNYLAGFVRLAIRDTSTCGNQPMVSSCGNFVLSFNGEIYNSDAFIPLLKNKGVVFKSHADTEVLLYGLMHLGLNKVLEEFDGMFAFAFYDKKKNELVLARDRVGIKPLYISFSKEYLFYSSQYDHVVNVDFVKHNSIDEKALCAYLQYGYMIAGNAVVQNTVNVPHGHYIVVNSTGYKLQKFYSFHGMPASNKSTEHIEHIFRQSVKQQMVSDVPLGTFLSGGVDSTLVNYWANDNQPVQAFTIGNESSEYDESLYAKEYAQRIGVVHHYKTITEKNFLSLVDDNFKAFTEPFADFSSIPTMLVAKMAKEFVTVILGGDGPDELFWGYDRNTCFPKKYRNYRQTKLTLALQKLAGKNISKQYFLSPDISSFYLHSLELYGSGNWLKKVFRPSISTTQLHPSLPEAYINPTDLSTAMQMIRWFEMNVHLQRILLKVDRSTMYYSLEARVPYLSNAILDYAATLDHTVCVNGSQGKTNIKAMLSEKVPRELVEKKKQGFLVPMAQWITREIKKDVYDTLLDMPAELNNFFNKKQLEKLLAAQVSKETYADGFIWGIYALVKWHSLHRNAPALQ